MTTKELITFMSTELIFMINTFMRFNELKILMSD